MVQPGGREEPIIEAESFSLKTKHWLSFSKTEVGGERVLCYKTTAASEPYAPFSLDICSLTRKDNDTTLLRISNYGEFNT
jgi:hypothetical protein